MEIGPKRTDVRSVVEKALRESDRSVRFSVHAQERIERRIFTHPHLSLRCSGSRMETTRAREQRIEMLKLNANGRSLCAQIICEWAHSQITVLANGGDRAHALCE